MYLYLIAIKDQMHLHLVLDTCNDQMHVDWHCHQSWAEAPTDTPLNGSPGLSLV